MAANLSDYARNALFGLTAGSAGVSMPATLHVKLHVGNPTAAGTGSPATHTTRQSFTRTAPSGGACSNVAAVTYASLAATEAISHISLWDAATAGNCWWWGPLTAPVTGNIGQPLTIPANDLDLQLT